MTLLTEVMDRPLDPSYAQAAHHRGKHYRQTYRERVVLLVLAVLVGLVVTAAVLWLRAPQPSSVHARSLLETEIADARAQVSDLKADNDVLRSRLATLQSTVLRTADPGLLRVRSLDALVAGQVPVTGEGVVVTLRDGADAQDDEDARVQDADLQSVVNELWAEGAEAIAVNGNRLGPTSTIRSAGSAILVDLVGLSSPYRVEAIGSSSGLATAFGRSGLAAQLQGLDASYGIRTSVTTSRDLSLPAAPARSLHVATSTESVPSKSASRTSGDASSSDHEGEGTQ